MIRTNEKRILKMEVRRTTGGRNRVNRPRQRWKKEVEDDIRKIDIKDQKEVTRDRERLMKIIEKARG